MSTTKIHSAFGGAAAIAALTLALAMAFPVHALRQDATPPASYSCETVSDSAATPGDAGGSMSGMPIASPMAGMEMDHAAMELDQAYIDRRA